MQDLIGVFADNFKFSINQEVRHKGDTKGVNADMGLLVLQRVIVESQDDDLNFSYERIYHCRMIRFSGSGDIGRFSERELQSIEEYKDKKLKSELENIEMRNEARQVEKEIMELFEINKEDYVYLIKNGEVDRSKKFRMCGFKTIDGIIELLLTESLLTAGNNDKVKRDSAWVSSKDQFVKIR